MDIVILGGTLSWENSQGQRGPQLAREFLHVIYVTPAIAKGLANKKGKKL